MMIWVYAQLAVVTLAVVPILYWLLRILARALQRETAGFRTAFENFSRSISRLLRELPLIENTGSKAQSREHEFTQIGRLRQSTRAFNSSLINYNVMHTLLTGVSGALVLVIGGIGIVQRRITPGQLLALYAGFSLLRNQWLAVSRAIPQIISGRESLLALCEILRTEYPPPYKGAKQVKLSGSVALEGVFFGYSDSLILKDVTMRIEPGMHAALIGETGAGKTRLSISFSGYTGLNMAG